MLLFLNLGGGEIVLILLVVLLLFGADKIPSMARGLAKGMREIKNAADTVKEEFNKSMEEEGGDFSKISNELEDTAKGIKKQVKDAAGTIKDTGKEQNPQTGTKDE